MLTVVTKHEDSIITYAAKQPDGSIEHTWSTWVYQTKMNSPWQVLTFNIMESAALEQEVYGVYFNESIGPLEQEHAVEKYLTKNKVTELATFEADSELDRKIGDAERCVRFNALNSVSPSRDL